MRLILPHPGHFAALKEILEYKESEGLKDVSEVYMAGSPDIMGSGRATLHAALVDEIKEQTAYAHQHNVKRDLRLIVNEGCLYKCPFRHAHFNLFSHITASRALSPQPQSTFGDYYFDKCISIRVRDPAQIILSPWIRPEDLKEYEAIGIDNFKMSGRANAVSWILNCMEAYHHRELKGNLLEVLDCPSELRYMFYVDNALLDGSINKWKSCNKICNECHYCDELTSKVLKVIEK